MKHDILFLLALLLVGNTLFASTPVVFTGIPMPGDEQGERLVFHVRELIEEDNEIDLLTQGAEADLVCSEEGFFHVWLMTDDPSGKDLFTMYMLLITVENNNLVSAHQILIDHAFGGPTAGDEVVNSAKSVYGMLKSAIDNLERAPLRTGCNWQ